ncbi:PilN domain-containing protein [Rhodoplanes azumiensis]|uniref:PilN domain-containing protein n=1 Tax=Rhodoplanes azumiensis TaxID=1897628 RepID=A0ABW5AP96_9BRAD
MSLAADIGASFGLWIDTLARLANERLGVLKPVRRIEVVEEPDGRFTLRPPAQGGRQQARRKQARRKDMPATPARVTIVDGVVGDDLPDAWAAALRGSRVDLLLQPSRVLSRPLDLPRKAGEFLDGIVRSQIDRLTPWSVADAVYHWTGPVEAGGDRIAVTVVATAKAPVVALSQALTDLGATRVDVAVGGLAAGTGPITLHAQRIGTREPHAGLRVALAVVLVVSALAATLALGAGGLVADGLESERAAIERRIAQRRVALRAGRNPQANSALDLLARRKHATPAAVMALESLSAALPDHTYATELRIEGDKLQVIGFSRDAAALIAIIEQSPQFTRATFFAPTTRSTAEPGERFHIEARLRPYFGGGS